MNKIIGGSHPINLSKKNIVFNCLQTSSKRCMIDGQGLSRMFYGLNVNVTFYKIIFANGYSSVSGGVIDIRRGSTVNLFNCTFVNNSATTGGAIMIKDTSFYMSGTQSSFINNTGYIPPLVGYSSNLTLYDTLFEGNSVTEYVSFVLKLLLLIYMYGLNS
jgi:predicted outer membrane repeat protein